MNMQDIERKIRLMREMQRMAEEAQAEADSLKDEIKAYILYCYSSFCEFCKFVK